MAIVVIWMCRRKAKTQNNSNIKQKQMKATKMMVAFILQLYIYIHHPISKLNFFALNIAHYSIIFTINIKKKKNKTKQLKF